VLLKVMNVLCVQNVIVFANLPKEFDRKTGREMSEGLSVVRCTVVTPTLPHPSRSWWPVGFQKKDKSKKPTKEKSDTDCEFGDFSLKRTLATSVSKGFETK
jgi:hypothetical protein